MFISTYDSSLKVTSENGTKALLTTSEFYVQFSCVSGLFFYICSCVRMMNIWKKTSYCEAPRNMGTVILHPQLIVDYGQLMFLSQSDNTFILPGDNIMNNKMQK